MLLTPLLVFKLCPPEINETPEAPKEARRRLEQLGPMTRDEGIMLATMGLAVTLWVRAPTQARRITRHARGGGSLRRQRRDVRGRERVRGASVRMSTALAAVLLTVAVCAFAAALVCLRRWWARRWA